MRICVTGATGFVGSALCSFLVASGHSVVKAVRKGIGPNLVAVGEISAATQWEDAVAGCHVVVHLAARVHVMQETVADPAALFDAINAVATRNLVQAAALAGVKRFVFISTVKVNGESTLPGRPFSETDTPAPQDAYARSKYRAEEELRKLAAQQRMEWVIIRPPLVYGPGVRANFAMLANAAAKGWPLPLGCIRNQRSLVALANLVDFIACCIQHPRAADQIFLISDGQDVSTVKLVQLLAQTTGVKARLPCIPLFVLKMAAAILGKRGSVERLSESLQVNISKSRTLLNWVPPVTVEQGLASVLTVTE